MEEKVEKKTKFELKMLPIEADMHLRVRQMSLDLSSPNHIPLNVRIAEFCEDPQSMDQMTEFVDDILKTAQIEADARLGREDKAEGRKNGKGAINGLKTGNFPDDDKPLKCYAYCVLEMSGILTKKKEFNEAKVKTQAELMLPAELREGTLRAWEACKSVALSLINGFKRGRMLTRAQTVFVRMFDAICNCTTQSAATLPTKVSSTRSLSTTK